MIKFIIYLESIFLLLISLRLGYLRGLNKKIVGKCKKLFITVGIVVCVAGCFQRINGQYLFAHPLDLIIFILFFISLFTPILHNHNPVK